ncbi:Qat anti-phage system QueC-like protein QatC [Lysinibacillus fusiformis]|uniref:ATPase n=1 Tax=Lysinibacillus fusiformis TaxID=28031 RepID=A0A2I0UZN8_9BACI|nr:Qat anti-phage system QueC-like protein QatC [Lysinibacillus fusiformis]PKU51479.1 ATPase [Lysinibacillus fusiformis]
MIQNELLIRIDSEDTYKIENDYIDYNLSDNSIFTYTFWDKNLKSLPNFFSDEGLDLFYISLSVFGADRVLLRDYGENAWKRNIKLHIPVLSIQKWEQNKALIESILNFLSGDNWELVFRERGLTKKERQLKEEILKAEEKYDYEKLCMFSGGLDSFIGVIDAIENYPNDKILFVSHYGGGKGVREYQNALFTSLNETYNLDSHTFYSFYASAKNGVEDTTRTRSLMFFAHAILLGTAIQKRMTLLIPENGYISLNIPLTNSRLGSSSTRTTHPYYMELLQNLLSNLNIDIYLENPYQFQTKGEMILNCQNIDFLKENLANTMSCSHPDLGRLYGESTTSHCGTCLPCIIRRASIKKANISDTSTYRDLYFESGQTAKMNLMSYNIGLHKYNKKYSFMNIQNSGPISKNISNFVKVYDRGMDELKELLESIHEQISL